SSGASAASTSLSGGARSSAGRDCSGSRRRTARPTTRPSGRAPSISSPRRSHRRSPRASPRLSPRAWPRSCAPCATAGPPWRRPVRQSGGAVVAVDETEIVEALGALARKGLYVEPTSAAAAAGLSRLLEEGAIRRDEVTVLVLTGTGLKASATIGELLKLGAR